MSILGLQGCLSVETDLNVVESGLVLNGDNGPIEIPVGDHKAQLSIAKNSNADSELAILDMHKKFRIHLPDAKKIVGVVHPIVVSAAELQQPIQMVFSRETNSDTDHYAIAISSADGAKLLASARFDYKGKTTAFDKGSNSFLMSFQKVKRSQRAAFIPIDGGLIQPFNGVVNHSAQILLAPWVYARYSNVKWFINSMDYGNREDMQSKVREAVSSSPVIDLFAFNHGGADSSTLGVAKDFGLKEHQVRLVYTEGCDSSHYFSEFLTDYGAAVAIGHRDTSASPLFAFNIVHSWAYGENAHTSMESGWIFGSAMIDIANVATLGQFFNGRIPSWFGQRLMWSSREDMLRESEPGIIWTSEMTPEKLNIDTSAVLQRNRPELIEASISFAGSYGKDIKTMQLSLPVKEEQNIQNPMSINQN